MNSEMNIALSNFDLDLPQTLTNVTRFYDIHKMCIEN